MVVRAQADTHPASDESLASLCQQYWPPLYAFVRRRGHSPHDAKDLTQEFFARFLEKRWLGTADQSRGKLRTFLLTAMKHFLANEWDKSQTLKRGGQQVITSLDEDLGESLLASAATLPDDSAYDRGWALTLLQTTLHRLQDEYASAGKLRDYEILKPSLTAARGEIDYDFISKELNILPSSARTFIHRIRQRFRELFRAEVAGTVATDDNLEEEILAVITALRHL